MARSITCRFRGVHGIPFRALTAGRTAEGAALMIHVQEPLVKQIAPNQYRRNCLSFQVMTHLKHFVKVCERIRTGLFCPYVLLLLYLSGKRNILLLWDSFPFPDCLFRQKEKQFVQRFDMKYPLWIHARVSRFAGGNPLRLRLSIGPGTEIRSMIFPCSVISFSFSRWHRMHLKTTGIYGRCAG